MKNLQSKIERQFKIVEMLKSADILSVNQLSDTLQVTPETIRNDLNELEKKSEIKRIHGGARLYSKRKSELHYIKRLQLNESIKRDIAKNAVQYIKDGDKIALDIGTTIFYMSDYLEGLKDITIITNSVSLAKRLNERIEQKYFEGEVVLLGGYTNPEQQSVSGPLTEEMLRRFRVNKAFISCGSIMNSRVYDYDLNEVHVSKTIMDISDFNILLCDSSKYEDGSFYEINPLERFNLVITNGEPEEDWGDLQKFWNNINR